MKPDMISKERKNWPIQQINTTTNKDEVRKDMEKTRLPQILLKK